jgi:death-on-curing protein
MCFCPVVSGRAFLFQASILSKASNQSIIFLTFDDVCEIHERGILEFGYGQLGFIDENAVRSAAAQPEVGADGKYFHKFPAGMAAAYLFYLANQQGFCNGNKRAAVGSALEFLARNGYRLNVSPYELYKMTTSLAGEDVKGRSKTKLAALEAWLRDHLESL